MNMSLFTVDVQVLDFIHNPHGKDFNALALAVFAQQFQLNLPYQRFCRTRGQTPDTITRWQDIPAVPTVAFKELDLTCGPPEKIFLTSGTTRGPGKTWTTSCARPGAISCIGIVSLLRLRLA